MKKDKGITLIALIITIIVMLILVGVTLSVALNGGLITKAQEAKKQTIEAQEKEQIEFALAEWKMTKDQKDAPTFEEFLKGIFGNDNVIAGGEQNEYIVTFPETGNQYKVKDDGTITSSKGIIIAPDKLTLTLEEGKEVTQEISATLNGIKGEIKWTNSEDSIAKISSDTGETVTVTAVSKGETTITASCGNYSAQCIVKVVESIPIGSYIKYNVEYDDIYIDEKHYSDEDGWRYLGRDESGNYLIVSTGVPLKLRYSGMSSMQYFNMWCGTDEQVKELYGSNLAGGVDNYEGVYAACGLMLNFEKLPYCNINNYPKWYSDNSKYDTVCGTVEGQGYLNPLGTVFRASDKLNEIEGVRCLNVDDIERACQACGVDRGGAFKEGYKDLKGKADGLFNQPGHTDLNWRIFPCYSH